MNHDGGGRSARKANKRKKNKQKAKAKSASQGDGTTMTATTPFTWNWKEVGKTGPNRPCGRGGASAVKVRVNSDNDEMKMTRRKMTNSTTITTTINDMFLPPLMQSIQVGSKVLIYGGADRVPRHYGDLHCYDTGK